MIALRNSWAEPVEAKVLELPVSGLKDSGESPLYTATQATHATLATRATREEVGWRWWWVGVGVESIPITDLNSLIGLTLPTGPAQNHALCFDFARGLRTLEILSGKLPGSTPDEAMLDAHDKWYEAALPTGFLTKSKEEYMSEFLSARCRARSPLGMPTLEQLWDRVISENEPLVFPPGPLSRFQKAEDFMKTLRLLRELQRGFFIKGQRLQFPLAGRSLAKLLGHANHSTMATWLSALQQLKTLKVMRQGKYGYSNGTRFASEYIYTAPLEPQETETPKQESK